MSYCRTGDHSDLYCYTDGRSWHLHVAANERVKGYRPSRSKDQATRYNHMVKHGYRPFQNKHASKSFNVATLEDLLTKLNELKADGVRIPKYAFDRVHRELKENN